MSNAKKVPAKPFVVQSFVPKPLVVAPLRSKDVGTNGTVETTRPPQKAISSFTTAPASKISNGSSSSSSSSSSSRSSSSRSSSGISSSNSKGSGKGSSSIKGTTTTNATSTTTTTSSSGSGSSSSSAASTVPWWQSAKNDPKPAIKMDEGVKWYELYEPFEQQAKQDGVRLEQSALKSLTAAVESTFNEEVAGADVAHSGGPRGGGGDKKWLLDMISAGTLSDKIAALALLVQESPPHQLEALDLLAGMAAKKEQRTAQLALQAIKDLLIHNLLPDRKLRAFKAQPLGHPQLNMPTAILFWYEDQLISRVQRVLDALDAGLKDTVEHFKKQCMETVAELLVSKPEQEARLLAMLVNKLGDPTGNVCAKCIELLRNVIRTHPAMKAVVVKEVKQLICRPGLPHRAVYSAVIFLSQVPLHHKDNEVATYLVEIYVSLFENAIAIKEMGFRLLSALLTGINHAFPFLSDKAPLAKHVDSLFRIAHGDSFSASTQALTLISLIALSYLATDADSAGDGSKRDAQGGKDKAVMKDGKVQDNSQQATAGSGADGAERESGDLTNRFYRALYAKLLSEQVVTRGRNTMFLNLLFRSIKRDPSDLRCMAFLKRLAMCATQSTPPIAAGLLFLISEVYRARRGLVAMMTEMEQVKDDLQDAGGDEDDHPSSQVMGNFDASKREPAYAASARPALWEASLLRMHFHPSVKAFSASLLDAPHEIRFAGDPTTEFSLTSFLNRFAYKNPKKGVSDKIRRPQPAAEEPLNTNTFLAAAASTVDPEKRFFHKFFTEQSRLVQEGRSHNRSRRADKGDDEDDDADAFDADGDGLDKEMDAFADKLAAGMMRDYANNLEDPDMDDIDMEGMEDMEDTEDMESDGGKGDDDDDEEGGEDEFDEGDGDDSDDEDGFDLDGDGDGEEGDDDEEDYGGLMAYGDDYDDEPAANSKGNGKGKGRELSAPKRKVPGRDPDKKKRAKHNGDFAEYSAEFEAIMDQRLAQVVNPKLATGPEDGKGKGKGDGKGEGDKKEAKRAGRR